MRRKVVCVLKRSETYDFDYIEKLEEGLDAHLKDFELQAIVDPPWPRWFSKMAMFDPQVKGDFLYLDLDTVIVGNIDQLFPGRLTVLKDFGCKLENFMASGVMFIPESERDEIWRAWIENPEAQMAQHKSHGDGGFLSKFWKFKADRWQDIVPGQIVSYRFHVRGKGVPDNARVVCFHGNPRPRTVNWIV